MHVTSTAGAAEEKLLALGAGESRILARVDRTVLARFGEDLRIALVETTGVGALVRLTPLDGSGMDLGVGRLVLVAPVERREVSLRGLFSEAQLEGLQLRVEVLRGNGRVGVIPWTSDGIAVRFEPEAEQVRRRPVRLKSTDALIDEAESSGAISSETAMLYRVYALFSDTRLPVQYRGTDPELEDSLYLGEVIERFNSLSPETQALIRPFLIPPAYQGSWASTSGVGPTALASQYPVPCDFQDGNYQYVDSPGGEARVWYQKGTPDELRAGSFASAISNRIWPKFYDDVMKPHRPLPDDGFNCNGGSPSLDIYLVNLGTNIAVPFAGCSGTPSPTYIYLKRDAELSTLAHEVFHAFQDSFSALKCNTAEEYRWWTEGSAVWASDFVYPNEGQAKQHGWAKVFLKIPEQPLDLNDRDHAYGSHLYPFFFHRSTGNPQFVRMAWERCATQPALEAVDSVTGSFEVMWPEFALYNWNNWTKEQITRSYFDWDSLMEGVVRETRPLDLQLPGTDRAFPIPVDLPRVSATYRYYRFKDPNVRTVAFWNGLTSSLSKPDEYETDAVAQDQRKGANITALIKIRGQDWTRDDWTNENFVSFCRDRLAERIDELVVITSNSEFAVRDRRLKHSNIEPLLWASNMGCWKWSGAAYAEVNANEVQGSKIEINTSATFTSFGGPAPGGVSPFYFYNVQGTENWKVTGTCTGSGTLPIQPGLGFLITYNFTPPGGTKHRGYALAGIDSRLVDVTCQGQPGKVALPPWVFSDAIVPPLPDVTSLGEIIGGYPDPPNPNSVARYTWAFIAESEPGPPPPNP
jgi:hypothetical protein